MERKWWKEAVIYQIYPRSFYDSNGDGIGDIKGIISKLDYLKRLGVDVIWLCPVYKSPNDDNGYDISDYYDIMDEFGRLSDWEELLFEMHKRGLKLIMDLVVNHTSDQHPWFIQSKSSNNNEKRDYYIWRKSKNGKEPNNWRSYFTPSTWKYDEESGEYYLHLFSEKQPDLNWDNPKVKDEIFQMMKWWLDKGIDGFRMDVINVISKPKGLPDSEKQSKDKDGYILDEELYANQPGVHEILKDMNKNVLSHYDVMTVGETPSVDPETAALYVGEDRNELNMVFQFELMGIDSGVEGKWDVIPWRLTDFKKIMTKWQLGLNGRGWNSLYLNNHDQPRMVSRFGDDIEYRVESAKMLATMLHTLQGTPYIYQGEEIGMTNVRFSSISDYRDIETLNMYNENISKGSCDPIKLMEAIYYKGRDNARTPMQWSNEKNAGFTTGTPWIKLNPNYTKINVEQAEEDENSILHYYINLINIRKSNLTIIYGDYTPILEEHTEIYSYLRCYGDDRILVILNFSGKESLFELPKDIGYSDKKLLIGNYSVDAKEKSESIKLRPYEAIVYRLV